MNTPKWTPGPWEWTEHGIVTPGNIMLRVSGVSQPCGYVPREDESYDNGRLIAAAPFLYEALELLIGELPTNRDWLNPQSERFARTALAKARGETK